MFLLMLTQSLNIFLMYVISVPVGYLLNMNKIYLKQLEPEIILYV